MNVPTQAHCGRFFQPAVTHWEKKEAGGGGTPALTDEVRPSSVVHRRLLAFVNLKAFFFPFIIPGAAVSTCASHTNVKECPALRQEERHLKNKFFRR